MNNLKSTFKYIVFVFIFMFLFMPNVKASSTTYLICDYEVGNDETIRLYYSKTSGKYNLYYAASKLNNGKWKYGTEYNGDLNCGNSFCIGKSKDHYHKINTNSGLAEDFSNEIASVEKCPTIYWDRDTATDIGKSVATVTSYHIYKIDDITCHYKMNTDDSKTVTYNMTGNYNGLVNKKQSGAPSFGNAKVFGHANTSTNWVSGFRVTNSFIDGIPDPSSGYDSSKNYSQQTYMYQYLKSVSSGGCFKSVISDGYRYYATFDSPLNEQDISNIVSDAFHEDGFKIYELYCNTDYEKKIKSIYDKETNSGSLVTGVDLLPDDYTGWEKEKKECDEFQNCVCRGKEDVSKYAVCRVQNIYESSYNILHNYKEIANKEGCEEYNDIFENNSIEMENYIYELLETLVEKGIVNAEDADFLKKHIRELQKELEDFYNVDFSVGFNTNPLECSDLFGDTCDKNDGSVQCLIIKLVEIIRILLPAILILLGSIDFAKVVISNEKEAMPKALSTFITRIVIAIAIFLLPIIIDLLITILNNAMPMKDKMRCIIENL